MGFIDYLGISERQKKILKISIDFIFWTFWFYFLITYLFYWNEIYAQPLIEAGEQCDVYCSASKQGTFKYLENSSFNIIWINERGDGTIWLPDD